MTNKRQKVYISDRQEGADRTPQLGGEASGQVVDTGHHHQTPEMSRRILLQSQLLQQAITTCTNQPTNRGGRSIGLLVHRHSAVGNLWPRATNAVTRVGSKMVRV